MSTEHVPLLFPLHVIKGDPLISKEIAHIPIPQDLLKDPLERPVKGAGEPSHPGPLLIIKVIEINVSIINPHWILIVILLGVDPMMLGGWGLMLGLHFFDLHV